jgi:ubiquinone/menaquinone biosynthesis C-methylase UbiE
MLKKIRLNLGCASRPLKNYTNIDQDNMSVIKKRYPNLKKIKNLKIFNYNIFKLPYKDNTVDEIRADGLIEHLSFIEEKKFFFEILRVVKKGGIIRLSTVDFEKSINLWLKAKDNWIDFHRNDEVAIKNQFWFGTYTYRPTNRWGYLTATFYGSQNGEGQFHKNCYTKKKLRAICRKLNLNVIELKNFRWKKNRDFMINLIAKKT